MPELVNYTVHFARNNKLCAVTGGGNLILLSTSWVRGSYQTQSTKRVSGSTAGISLRKEQRLPPGESTRPYSCKTLKNIIDTCKFDIASNIGHTFFQIWTNHSFLQQLGGVRSSNSLFEGYFTRKFVFANLERVGCTVGENTNFPPDHEWLNFAEMTLHYYLQAHFDVSIFMKKQRLI